MFIYTGKLLHAEAFLHRQLLHREAVTHRSFCRQKLLQREAFTQRHLYAQNGSRIHKALPSTTLYYKPRTKYFPVQLRTTKLAQSTSQYNFVLQSLHKVLPSTTLYYKACIKFKALPSTISYTEKLLHTDACAQGNLLHREAFTQRSFYTASSCRQQAFTQRSVYAQWHGPHPGLGARAKKRRF